MNLADETEQQIVNKFETNLELEEWRGTSERDGQPYLTVATPIRFGASCMRCHGDPADAPSSLLERYGETNGFGRQEGDVAIKLVSVPVTAALATARTHALVFAILVGVSLVALFVLVSRLLSRFVAGPLQALHRGATRIGEGQLDYEIEMEGEDEIAELGDTFNQMTLRLRERLHSEQEQRGQVESLVREEQKQREDLQHILDQVRDAADGLNSTAAEIMTATTQQASGASEQSAAITQTTTTVDELKTIAEQSVARAQPLAGTERELHRLVLAHKGIDTAFQERGHGGIRTEPSMIFSGRPNSLAPKPRRLTSRATR